MGKKFLFFGVLLLGLLISSTPALAYNQQLTVYASVPPMRAVYLNADGNIIKVAGNTSGSVTPQVYNDKSQLVSLTDSIQTQYQQFLQSHSGHLEAGKTYNVNPITVNIQLNDQTIKLDTTPIRLSLSL
jgi:hypothetical protein